MVKLSLSRRARAIAAVAAIGLGSVGLGAAALAQAPGMGFHGHGMMHSQAMRQFRLSQRLAAAQVYLGITPQQEPQWQAFTAAMLAMVPDRRPPADGATANGGTGPAAEGSSRGDAFAAIDRMTTRVQTMAQSAGKLHDAAGALKAVLTPDQIGKANALWVSLRHRGPMGGPMGGPGDGPMGRPGGWHHGPGREGASGGDMPPAQPKP